MLFCINTVAMLRFKFDFNGKLLLSFSNHDNYCKDNLLEHRFCDHMSHILGTTSCHYEIHGLQIKNGRLTKLTLTDHLDHTAK